jgi:acetyltransferase-like isoleucine patch superfamily enzyme
MSTTIPIPIEFSDRFKFLSTQYPDFDQSCATIYQPCVILNKAGSKIANDVRIDSFSKLECGQGTIIGQYVHVASFSHLGIGGGFLICEEGSAFGSGSRIITGSNIPAEGVSCSAISPSAIIRKSFVWVRRNAIIFAGATVLPGVIIGAGAVVAAGAVVNKDVPDGEIWGGVPARRIGMVGQKSAENRERKDGQGSGPQTVNAPDLQSWQVVEKGAQKERARRGEMASGGKKDRFLDAVDELYDR